MIPRIILLFSLLQPNYVIAQKHTMIEMEISRLEQMGVNGILEADTNLLKKLWAPEFMVNTPRNNIAKNRDAVFQNQKIGLIDYSSFERNVEEIRVHKNVVITMGNEVFVSRVDLPEAKAGVAVKRRFTNVWMKKKGDWKQVGRHASVICTQ